MDKLLPNGGDTSSADAPVPASPQSGSSVDSGSAVTNAMEQLTTDSRDKMEVMEDSGGSSGSGKTGSSSQLQQHIKPLLSGSSLFGLLVKLCVGSLLRQRRGQQIPPTPAMPAPPARSAPDLFLFLIANISVSKFLFPIANVPVSSFLFPRFLFPVCYFLFPIANASVPYSLYTCFL